MPALLAVIGLTLTLGLAQFRSVQLERERQLLFDAEAGELQRSIVATVENRIDAFRSGVNFIATTHPSTIERYELFFTRERPDLEPDDPGILFLEEVDRADLDALTAREHDLGNTDFAVHLFPSPAPTKLILTRTVNDVEAFGLSLRGLDTTIVRDSVLPRGFSGEDFELRIVESRQLLGFAGAINADDNPLGELTALLIAGVVDGDGQFLGYAINFDSTDTYLDALDKVQSAELNVELWVEGIGRPIGQRLTADAGPPNEADLADRHTIESASLDWSIHVWANDEFGPATGLLGQRWILVPGLALSTLSAIGALWRDHTNRRLDAARVQLDRVRTLAVTDDLTGLLNRKGFIDAAREIDPQIPAALFFIDLDGFKAVNDENGHEHGDRILSLVAEQLTSVFRNDDLVGRLGGDEFVVFTLDAVEPPAVEAISNRINQSISHLDHRITASLGIATRTWGQTTDVKELLRSADEAMYEAKRAGGDRHELRL